MKLKEAIALKKDIDIVSQNEQEYLGVASVLQAQQTYRKYLDFNRYPLIRIYVGTVEGKMFGTLLRGQLNPANTILAASQFLASNTNEINPPLQC